MHAEKNADAGITEEIHADQKLFSSVLDMVKQANLEGKLVSSLLNMLGKDFTYPSYDETNAETKEVHPVAEQILEAINGHEVNSFLANMILEINHVLNLEIEKMSNSQMHEQISSLFEERLIGETILPFVHMFSYELQGVISEAQRSVSAMDWDEESSGSLESDLFHALMGWCITTDNAIRKADNMKSRGMDYSNRLRESMRNLLTINQAMGIIPYEVRDYLDSATKGRKGLNELFKSMGSRPQNFKVLKRPDSNDNMFG